MENLELVIFNTEGNLYWKNNKLEYMGCNANFLKISKLNNIKEIIGKTDFELFSKNLSKEKLDLLLENDKKVIFEKATIVLEETGINEKGEIATYMTKKSPLIDGSGKVIGLMGNSIDITERKQQEIELKKAKKLAEEADIIKTEFMANMRHDIRTPFTGLIGFADYLWKQETDPEKKELLGYINLCAKELLDYCNSILDFSKIENGHLPMVENKFHLKSLTEKVLATQKPMITHKGLELKMEYDHNIPPVLKGDHHRIYRILINLLGNAVKFTDSGWVGLKVELIRKIEKDILIRFTIEDTGSGIPKEKNDYIFEKFSRLTPSYQGIYKGTGLGLRIVKQFVHELEGEIDLISEPNKGTKFIYTIPFKIPLTDDFAQ